MMMPVQEAGSKSVKRNYPALAAALQTLGYSVAGFIASAVVSLDGTPIAQVAVDDLDISPMCAHLSGIVQNTLQALQQGYFDHYEHTIITSNTQHILLRLVGKQQEVFQVLITTRETNPNESLDVMANVEAAIVTALH
jgi:predicted regulator of Ras-like GTPase activity (Roadblock/LC7/MglB family)